MTRITRRAKSPRKPSSARAQRERAAQRADAKGWKLRHAGCVNLIEALPLARVPWLVHAFSTRVDGGGAAAPAFNLGFTESDSRGAVAARRGRFAASLGSNDWPMIAMRQSHFDAIHVLGDARSPADPPRADALLTQTPGLLLAVQTADCVPILLVDTRRRAVAAVHAGWRGTLARIAQKALGKMRMEFGTRPADVIAAMGPSIGPCCYEVGPEVAQAFAAQFDAAREWFQGPFERLAFGEEPNPLPWLTMMPPGHQPPPPRVQLDLRAANRRQLLDAGVAPSHIVVSPLCTACRTDLLFSYRREGAVTGRLMAAIGIRPKQ